MSISGVPSTYIVRRLTTLRALHLITESNDRCATGCEGRYSALTGRLAHQDEVTTNKQTDYLSGGGVTVRRQGIAFSFDHLDAQGSAVTNTDTSEASCGQNRSSE